MDCDDFAKLAGRPLYLAAKSSAARVKTRVVCIPFTSDLCAVLQRNRSAAANSCDRWVEHAILETVPVNDAPSYAHCDRWELWCSSKSFLLAGVGGGLLLLKSAPVLFAGLARLASGHDGLEHGAMLHRGAILVVNAHRALKEIDDDMSNLMLDVDELYPEMAALKREDQIRSQLAAPIATGPTSTARVRDSSRSLRLL